MSIPLDPKQEFGATLPDRLVKDEPRRERIVDIWNTDVCAAINSLCRARRSGFINKVTRKTVFHSGMENVCKDFSRKTEHVKVAFQHHDDETTNGSNNNKRKTTYPLQVTRLSNIPEEIRSVRPFCVAEIPARIQEVEAELVGTVEEEEDPNNAGGASKVNGTHHTLAG